MQGSIKVVTYTGHMIDLSDDVLDLGSNPIQDIAAHLSRIPRFCGATRKFYSVAEHSILVAEVAALLAKDEFDGISRSDLAYISISALLHEAEEAYGLGDINGDLKRSFTGDTLRHLKHIKRKIYDALGICTHCVIDIADTIVLIYEWEILLRNQYNRVDVACKSEEIKNLALSLSPEFESVGDILRMSPRLSQRESYNNFIGYYNNERDFILDNQ